MGDRGRGHVEQKQGVVVGGLRFRGVDTDAPAGGAFQVHGLGGEGEGSDAGMVEGLLGGLAAGHLVSLPEPDEVGLALSDVMSTGHHGAVTAGVGRGDTVLVVGDGAVGRCAVIAARRLGAERILLAGRHEARTGLGRELGASEPWPASPPQDFRPFRLW
ncbi:hypothetical protein TU94_03560 [Streptomyces cyaneogriseus subsp. noncyanogenus]|uniref:Alcohol dehydrogenase-like C-terminal domain-containing protein n=1 Tax=Streptomyces cyaneogriseus subsp. noncyanogenus TaxID=477245 RepID=A0A0C5FXW6_9ACTN|nr:hypothetical protein TU94_03560 [Streptomyces cyaneogriseus subsp. noncyanogenus]